MKTGRPGKMETVARQAAGLWMKRYQDCKAFEYLKKKKKKMEVFQRSFRRVKKYKLLLQNVYMRRASNARSRKFCLALEKWSQEYQFKVILVYIVGDY